MEVKVIARTFEVDSNGNAMFFNGSTVGDLFTLGGKAAGVCYMPEDYFDSKIQNVATANKRANFNIGSGHHSPFDHGSISLQISGIPKILAMIINSTEFYTTSEKSARYTVMKPETELEDKTYHKWIDRFTEIISNTYPEIDSKTVVKLAQENARYMLSVFTPTHMIYTTTFRQISYMSHWLTKLVDELTKRPNKFNNRLIPYCSDLAVRFAGLTNGIIEDTKANKFHFLVKQYGGPSIDRPDHFSDIYETVYKTSFASLAQAHRHRTIHYEMEFSGDMPGEYGCFVPPIIAETEYKDEWINDFEMLADQFPQCTLVKVLEQSRAHWFFVKCKERLCGRAQLEIAMKTAETMQKFIDNRDNLSEAMKAELDKCTNNGTVCTKCMFKDFTCKEPCQWGAKSGLVRKV